MSLEIRDEQATVAGRDRSTVAHAINEATREESSIEAAIDAPEATGSRESPRKRVRRREPAPPRPLVLVCHRCHRPVIGSGAGYAFCDLRVAALALRTPTDSARRAAWTLAHRECAPEVLDALTPWFRVWVDRIHDVDGLLDAMVDLSRHPWFAGTAWGSLTRGILADTETAHTPDETRRADNARRARRVGEYRPSPDTVHGTSAEYQRGCRCEDCRTAHAESKRAQRAAAVEAGLAPDDPRHGTLGAFDWYKCRCAACRYAKSLSRQQVSSC